MTRGTQILVVDDDPGIRSSLSRALTMAGYLVRTAAMAGEALREMDERVPDLIVLDLMLPGTSGLDLCRHLTAHHEIPVLILTARQGVTDRVAGLESGAEDYLMKPFALEELLAVSVCSCAVGSAPPTVCITSATSR